MGSSRLWHRHGSGDALRCIGGGGDVVVVVVVKAGVCVELYTPNRNNRRQVKLVQYTVL